jgi:WhiB family redox-sensing transcriptional regulator
VKDDFPILSGDISWQEKAACLGYYHKTGEDLFFPPDNPGGPKQGIGIKGEAVRIRKARQVCLSCPVRLRCLEFAIVNGCSGFWGGTTDGERKKIVREQAAREQGSEEAA